jgi:hypothetical protein
MSDHTKPTTLSNYSTAFLPELHGRIDDAVKMLDPVDTAPTNLPVGARRVVDSTKRIERWSGSAWAAIGRLVSTTNATAQTELGISTFIQGLLVNINGGTAKKTLGIANKNLLINGGFNVNQYGTTAVNTGQFVVDRWLSSVSAGSIQPVSDTVGGTLAFASNTSASTLTIRQRLPLEFCRGVASKTLAFSIQAADIAGVVTTLTWGLYSAPALTNNFTSPTLITSGTFTLTTTMTGFSATIAAPSTATGGLELRLTATLPVGGLSNIKLAQAKLEISEAATPFEYETRNESLDKCQYFYKRLCGIGWKWWPAATSETNSIKTPVSPMRVIPQVAQYGNAATTGNCTIDSIIVNGEINAPTVTVNVSTSFISSAYAVWDSASGIVLNAEYDL